MSDFDLSNLDFDAAEKAVQEAHEQEVNTPSLEANDGCEGGACIL